MFISVLVLKDPSSPRVYLSPSSQGSIFSCVYHSLSSQGSVFSSCLSQSQFSRIHLLLCLSQFQFSRIHLLLVIISVLVLKDPSSPCVYLSPSSQGSIFSSCLSQSQFSIIHLLLVIISVLVLNYPSSPRDYLIHIMFVLFYLYLSLVLPLTELSLLYKSAYYSKGNHVLYPGSS